VDGWHSTVADAAFRGFVVPRLAIVISAVGSVESLEGTLVSVLENRPADCEIIVVLSRPYADPYDLAHEVKFLAPQRGVAAIAAINRAVATTRASFVHLVTGGCRASEGWADAALARFGDREVGSVAPLVWDARANGRILAAGVGYRPRGRRYLVGRGLPKLTGDIEQAILGPCSFAAFYRKAALEVVGGLAPRLGLRQIDADVALLLRQAGYRTAIEPRSNLQAGPEVDFEACGFRQALADERLFRRNLVGPGKLRAVAAHAGMVALELAGSFPRPRFVAQAFGRLAASCEIVSYARHRRAVEELGARTEYRSPQGKQLRVDGLHGKRPRANQRASRLAG
jgi:hypothetical protein